MVEVCFISPEYLPLSGGTGSYVYYLSKELIKNNYSTSVVTGYAESKDIRINKQQQAFFVKTLKVPIIRSFLFARAAFRKLKKINEINPMDITHVNLPLVPSFAVPRNVGRVLISTVHSTWKGEAEAIKDEPYSRLNSNEKFMVSFNWLLKFFEEKTIEHSNKIIAVSDFTRRELLKYYNIKENKIRVIHNGVDITKFSPPTNKREVKQELGFNEKDVNILSVGRLYARKGLFTLLESMSIVAKKFSNAKLIISGKGQSNEMKKLVNYAKKLGVRDKIIFTGYFPDAKLPKLYQAADIFAFSTFYENLPFAVLEALSSRLPVVTTKVGGIPEMIDDGKNGFLVPPANSADLAKKILCLIENPSVASEMAYRARKTVEEKFDWKLIVKKVLRVYQETLN
jgi:glycosyltransferase involved in cell wall biosynthesis